MRTCSAQGLGLAIFLQSQQIFDAISVLGFEDIESGYAPIYLRSFDIFTLTCALD